LLTRLNEKCVVVLLCCCVVVLLCCCVVVLLCCISGLGPEGLGHNCTISVWSHGNLLRVTFAST
jgi:hypothetical protein